MNVVRLALTEQFVIAIESAKDPVVHRAVVLKCDQILLGLPSKNHH
jgi:hypothetical protein